MTSRTRGLLLILAFIGSLQAVSLYCCSDQDEAVAQTSQKPDVSVPGTQHDNRQQAMELLPSAIGTHRCPQIACLEGSPERVSGQRVSRKQS